MSVTDETTRHFLFPGEYRPPVLYRRVGIMAVRRGEAAIAWWLLPRKRWLRYEIVTWLHSEWWTQLRHELVGIGFRAGMWLGVWDLREEGGYFVDGYWCWDFWRSPRSFWRRKAGRL